MSTITATATRRTTVLVPEALHSLRRFFWEIEMLRV